MAKLMPVCADLAVVNGRLVTPQGVRAGGLAVVDGRIHALLSPDDPVQADRVIDAKGKHVLPGIVDSHVHFRVPGLRHKEDWEHGSRAAAAGGVTTVIDMPNTSPWLLDPADVRHRAEMVEGRSLVDFCFHLGVQADRLQLLDAVRPGQVAGVKVFMAGHRTATNVVRDTGQLAEVFERAARLGLRLVLHAEDDAVFGLLDAWRSDRRDNVDYEASRPRSGAIVAVARIIELVRRYGTAAHVLHVSSAEETDLLAAAGRELPITFEVTAHHLTFTQADVRKLGPWVKLSPAVRTRRDRNRLRLAVASGEAATIGSDHAPHTREEKLAPAAASPPGLPGVQELLPAVHTVFAARYPSDNPDLRLHRIAQLLAAAPADLFGLGALKGRLAIGLDADFVIFDAEEQWSLDPGSIQAKCRWSAYERRPLVGRPLVTVRRGEVIWDADSRSFGSPLGHWLTTAVGLQRPVSAGEVLQCQ